MEPDVENPRGTETTDPSARPSTGALSLRDVSVMYPGGRMPALANVTLSVSEGEVVALLGANGAGKSTLLRVAAALVVATGGSAHVFSCDVKTLSRRALARLVALVPQNEQTSARFKVRDVVGMGRAAHQGLWMIETPADRLAIDDALERCDLAHLSDRPVDTLSGGEQRRVAVARALAQKPRLLLLDEPASFLDVRHRLELYERIAEVAERDRVACVCAMHDLEAAGRFASRIVLMRAGRVEAVGTPGDVMTSSKLQSALGARIAVGVHRPSGHRYFLPLRSDPRERG